MSSTAEIAGLIAHSKRILVVTGAGISTSSGIPDFRSPGGLYATAEEKYKLPYPEAIFDLNYFEHSPEPFFMLSRELLEADVAPTLSLAPQLPSILVNREAGPHDRDFTLVFHGELDEFATALLKQIV